ncbi:MAG: hypothetical protein LCH30_01030 [Proteobacteria bacterium]|nr:hypothetical protein [Pseudomonadota bacterium]
MKKQKRILASYLLCQALSFVSPASFAGAMGNAENSPSPAAGFSANAVYSYSDFKFNSFNTTNSFNRYKGHFNFYGLGGNDFKINDRFKAGVFLYRLDTQINSEVQLPDLPYSISHQTVRNNSIYGHVLGQAFPFLYFDLAAGYGQNSGNLSTNTIFSELPQSFGDEPLSPLKQGYANTYSKNWFVNIAALLNKSWGNFNLSGNVIYLYTEVLQDPYSIDYLYQIEKLHVEHLQNKASFLLENAEIGYRYNSMMQPFFNVGLIQVLSFDNSRNLLPIGFIGPAPALNLDMNGYKVGGGINLTYKRYLLRFEQQYFERSSAYRANQSTVTFRVSID